MKVQFLELAQLEVDDAVAWYNSQSSELGLKFLDELDKVIRRIVSYPLSCPKIESGLRRGLMARFPYGAIYGIDSGSIIVVAIAHLHRGPKYWMERL